MTARPRPATAPVPADALLDAQQACAYLNVGRTFLTENMAALGGIRLGDGPKARLRFRLSDLEAYVERHRARPAPASVTPLGDEREKRRPVLKHTSAVCPLDNKPW